VVKAIKTYVSIWKGNWWKSIIILKQKPSVD
jgi:hypothetical protein